MTDASASGAEGVRLEQAIGRLAHTLERSLPAAFIDMAGDLDAAAEFDPASSVRQALTATGGLLRLQAGERAAAVVTAIGDRARRCQALAGNPEDDERWQALLRDDEADGSLLVGDLARAIRAIAGADYLVLAQRTARLMPHPAASDDLNPLGARTLAAGALRGIDLPASSPADVRSRVRQALLRRLPAVLALALDDLGRWLEQARMPAASASSTGAPEVDAGVRLADASQVAAATADVLASSPLARVAVTPLPALPSLQPVVELERDAVAFAHRLGVPPYGRQARARFFANARSRLVASGVSPAQLAIVDLVAALFDYVVDEQRLPEIARAMLWRLQQPALALSLLDPGYLADEPRSLRRLVENLAAMAGAYADDLAQGSELQLRLETVVRAVEVVAGALQARAAVMARQVEREYARASRNVSQLIDRLDRDRRARPSAGRTSNRRDYRRRPSQEREQEVTVRLSVLLGERLERHRVPESVREFLLKVWLRQLRTTALRDGEDSGEFKVAMQVVDDLLWSLDPDARRTGRSELAARIPPLIRLLTQGVREVGVRDEELKPFFDELFLVHLRRMQGGEGAGADERRDRPAKGGGAPAVTPVAAAAVAAPASPAATPASPAATPKPAPVSPSAAVAEDASREAAGDPGASVDSAPDAGPTAAEVAAERSKRQRTIQERRAGRPPGTVTLPESRRRGVDPSGLAAPGGDDATGDRLLQVLSSLDLTDLPAEPADRPDPGDDPVSGIDRGTWLRMKLPDGSDFYAKVAWVNERRTVALMVRHPDRRALSMRMVELADRFARGQAFVVATD
jgi:hypothetical protein